MTILVEDGTGLPGAQSYESVINADSYFSDRGVSSWATLSEAEKEIALIKGSEYADLRWGQSLVSKPLASTQALEFPRVAFYDRYGTLVEGVPLPWKRAVLEYSLVAATGELLPATPTTGQELKSKKTTVGPITTELEYKEGVTSTTLINYPVADRLASKFTYGGVSGVTRVIR